MASSLELLTSLPGHLDRVWHVAWDPTGSFLASCGGDRSIRIWALPHHLKQQHQDRGREVEGNQGQATPNEGGGDEWKLLATLEDGQTRTVRCVEWSPCGKSFLSPSMQF